MDEAIRLLRACWSDAQIDFKGHHYQLTAIGMEPEAAAGRPLADLDRRPLGARATPGRASWATAGSATSSAAPRTRARRSRRSSATPRPPGATPRRSGCRRWSPSPPRDAAGKRFYVEHDRVVARVVELKKLGFEWVALNATAIFQSGARSVAAMIDALGALHTKIRGEVG
jgi:alkanesulfonate monooxygenase SsuD/methylene tetrahydromethanopterin reductase-like flavin-dependent oxidoreductase (luciferase family)